MATLDADTESVPQVVFRPGKKRKIYRQRAEEPESTADDNNSSNGHDNSNDGLATEAVSVAASTAAAAPVEDDANGEEEGLSVAEVLRLRNQRKHKHGGVGFRAGPSSSLADDRATPSEENTEQGLVLHGSADPTQQGAESAVVVGGISKRFAPQTGLVGELVNKHMEEYVESELARRKRQQQQQEQELEEEQERQRRANGTTSTSVGGQLNTLSSGLTGGQADAQRVLHGRLLEIDLGEEARARNVEMTERARRRLQGQIDEEDGQDEGGGGKGRPRKVRLGRDGRPLRARNRRGSDDIKRDQLVEEFLSENRLDMYDTTQHQPGTSTDPAHTLGTEEGDEDGMAADDRIAEEFRREFMEAMSQRNRRRRAPQPSSSKNNAQEEILRGPKLGGSRNARAAMRDLLLKEQVAKGRGR